MMQEASKRRCKKIFISLSFVSKLKYSKSIKSLHFWTKSIFFALAHYIYRKNQGNSKYFFEVWQKMSENGGPLNCRYSPVHDDREVYTAKNYARR